MPTPPKKLPIAPKAPPARRNLPLADRVREIDVIARPILAVWEITLACDLACGHCGSRAGRARPDELTTDEALHLVDQLAELGVIEVVLIGGESYLREDWCEIIARIAERGMQPLLTTGGRGMTPERAARAAAAGLVSASVSPDGLAATHDLQRGVPGSFAAAIEAMANPRAAGVEVSANTQINRLSMSELPEVLEDDHRARRAQLRRSQITVAMGRAADRPEWLLQPYDLLALFPMLGGLAARCREADVLLWPGNNVGYFGPYETTLVRHAAARPRRRPQAPACGYSASRPTARSRAARRSRRRTGPAATCATRASSTSGSARRRCATLRDPHRRVALGLLPHLLLRRRVSSGGCTWTSEALLGKPGNNPALPSTARSSSSARQARAARAGRERARAARSIRGASSSCSRDLDGNPR